MQSIADRAVISVLKHLNVEDTDAEVAILACDDPRIAVLNADFRDKQTATNVLSWPTNALGSTIDGDIPQLPLTDSIGTMELGDIAISYDTCVREADQASKPLVDHVMHLIVHGTLHLLGYDHVRDQDATLMETLEVGILENMGIDDPYYENRVD